MSLATRCTACGTIFKVVQDQLKVSEGWVRCGRCHQVFNALEGLFDLDRDPPPQRRVPAPVPSFETAAAGAASHSAGGDRPWPDGQDTPAEPSPQRDIHTGTETAPGMPSGPAWAAAAAAAPPSPPPPDVPATHEDDALDSRWLVTRTRDTRSARERQAWHADSDFSDARFPLDAAADEALDQNADDDATALSRSDGFQPMPPVPAPGPVASSRSVRLGSRRKSEAAGERTPAFVRRAQRQAQWRHPVVRLTLAFTALCLTLLLALQGAVHYRDWLAAYRPDLQPWLSQLCNWAGCRILPLQQIEAWTVDSVTLQRTPGADSALGSLDADSLDYRLSVTLHNRSALPLAVPQLELTLTDANGGIASRRIVSPRELGAPSATAAPSSNVALSALLRTSGPRVAGYTVELFHP